MNSRLNLLDENLQKYRHIISLMEAGDLQSVADFAEELRKQVSEFYCAESELLRRLLVTRLSYKQNGRLDDIEFFLNKDLGKTALLNAESLFVQGLYHFHNDQFAQGAEKFANASDHYFEIQWADRALLCLYNNFVGQLNANQLDRKAEEARLSYLERLMHHHKSEKNLGLVLRHKASFLEDQGSLRGAVIAAQESLPYLKTHAPVSDYQLGVLQCCLLLFKLNKNDEALAMYEGLLGPFDARVAYPKDLVAALLLKKYLPNMRDYKVISKRWRKESAEKIEALQGSSLLWDADQGILVINTDEVPLKRDSVEGRILSLLIDGKRNKSELCALLWPDEAESTLIWDRLNKGLQRLKKKHTSLVARKDQYYVLGCHISLARAS